MPDLTALEAATDKLAVDDAYNDLAERGTAFVIPGSVTDSLLTVIHGNQPDPSRQTEYVSVVRSTAVAGHLARGFALGVEIKQKAEKITGIPTAFLAGPRPATTAAWRGSARSPTSPRWSEPRWRSTPIRASLR